MIYKRDHFYWSYTFGSIEQINTCKTVSNLRRYIECAIKRVVKDHTLIIHVHFKS